VPYTAEKPTLARPSSELRTRITGWGVDLDPRDRPSIPKEKYDPAATGAHWHFPERQIAHYPRERSTEHRFLTPVFGTVCPPRGLSGLIRRYAYTFSEGRTAHWTLLVLADRVDVVESRVKDFFRLRPDIFVTEMGLGAEIKRHGLRSRIGKRRADLVHLPIDVLIFAATTAAFGAGMLAVARAITPRRKRLGILGRMLFPRP
jgi:hypothetical protein